MLSALEREKKRLVDAYQAEVIELAELAERRQRLSEQDQLLRTRVQEIEQQRLDRSAELRLLEGVAAFCASIRDAMATPSFEVKQKVLQLVVQRIVVEDHRLIIEHVVPSGPIRLQTERHPPEKAYSSSDGQGYSRRSSSVKRDRPYRVWISSSSRMLSRFCIVLVV
jgi:hypothetical protein